MFDILITVIPVFLVIGGGYAASRAKVFSSPSVDGLMYFTQGFAIPCLLFTSMAELDLGAVFDWRLLLSFYGGATACFAIAILLMRYVFRRRPGESVAVGFGALFSNSLLLGLPITERAFGAEALGPNFGIISIHSPFCYLLGITVMEFARAEGRGLAETARAVVKAMFRNTLMIGLALGLAVNVTGLAVPEPVWAAADMMARAALPAALFGLGGILTRYRLRESLGEAMTIAGLSLILHPLIALGLGAGVFNLSQGFLNSLVMTAAMAPGVNAYVFANLYNRGKDAAASAVLLGTLFSVVTASVWLYVLRH